MLVIADDAGPGRPWRASWAASAPRSAPTRRDVFFEAAFFAPDAIAGRARRLGLLTDASQRFERGVDPTQQAARHGARHGAAAGRSPAAAPGRWSRSRESLQHCRRARRCGCAASAWRACWASRLPDGEVTATLDGPADAGASRTTRAGRVTPPPHRFDIAIEADLIEEVARIVGFDAIPESDARASAAVPRAARGAPGRARAARGAGGARLPGSDHLRLRRSGAAGAAVPGRAGAGARESDRQRSVGDARVAVAGPAASAALENQRRQQDRVRLFEHGTRFVVTAAARAKSIRSPALPLGARLPEQWGMRARSREPVDFFDVKADLEALLRGDRRCGESFSFEAGDRMPCLHPGPHRARCCAAASAVGLDRRAASDAGAGTGFYICAGAVRAGYCSRACGCAQCRVPRRFRASRRCGATWPSWWTRA